MRMRKSFTELPHAYTITLLVFHVGWRFAMARPKSGKPVLSAPERAKKSNDTLAESGGRRFNLRLSKEANDALDTIVEFDEYPDETSAINGTLIARGKQIKRRLKSD